LDVGAIYVANAFWYFRLFKIRFLFVHNTGYCDISNHKDIIKEIPRGLYG